MQLCSVIWLPCGVNLEANLDEAVISPHLTFSLPSPLVSLLDIQIAFFHSGKMFICHKICQNSFWHQESKLQGIQPKVLHQDRGRKSNDSNSHLHTQLHQKQHASLTTALWAVTLHHFPFPVLEGEKLCGYSLGPFCQARKRKGKGRGGEVCQRRQQLSYPCRWHAEVRGATYYRAAGRSSHPCPFAWVVAKLKGSPGKLQPFLTAKDQGPYVGVQPSVTQRSLNDSVCKKTLKSWCCKSATCHNH